MKRLHACFIIMLVFSLGACEKKTTVAPTEEEAGSTPSAETPTISKEASENLFSSGAQALDKTLDSATQLKSSIDTFLASPTQDNLKKAQERWLSAALDYQLFNFYRHIGLVEPTLFAQLNRLDYQIGTYPIQPGFLDKFGPYKFSGLVHDISFPLTEESLINQHGLTDLGDIVLGLYAIEFFLFSVDEPRDEKDFIEATTIDDDHKARGFEKVSEIPNNRRRSLLQQQASLLVSDVSRLTKTWNSNEATSTLSIWSTLTSSEQISLIKKSLASSLTQLLVDIGEINQDESKEVKLPPTIKNNTFQTQQVFIHNALSSTQVSVELLDASIKDTVAEQINLAIEKSKSESLEEKETQKEYWRSIFAMIKNANDSLLN